MPLDGLADRKQFLQLQRNRGFRRDDCDWARLATFHESGLSRSSAAGD